MTTVFDLDRVLTYLAGQLRAGAGVDERLNGRIRPLGETVGSLEDLVPISSYHLASFTLEASVRLIQPLQPKASEPGPVRFAMEAPAEAPRRPGVDDLLIRMDGQADGVVQISRWRSVVKQGRRAGGWSDDADGGD